MRRGRYIRFLHHIALAIALVGAALAPLGAQPPAACTTWRDCQTRALAAEQEKDFEAFHDFAWRTVQVGPKNDFTLLLLLARAQALSGRPHDALVMLERLATNPAVASVLTDEAFERTRELPGWPEVEARITSARDGASAPTPASARTPGSTGRAAVAAPEARTPTTAGASPPPSISSTRPAVTSIAVAATETARFAAPAFTVASLAYDSVSDRAIVADRSDRKVIVASRTRASDLVRGDSAGFHDITATAADPIRGDLWVASGNAVGMFEMHRLQLLSGRPLKTYALNAQPCRIVDVAVSRDGRVFALDAAVGRILEWHPGGAAFEPLVSFDAHEVSSLALAEREGAPALAYVADADGVIRIDLATRRATRLGTSDAAPLPPIERVRVSGRSLIAVVRDGDVRRLVRLELARGGVVIDHLTPIETSEPLGAAGLFTVSGDELFYLGNGSPAGGASAAEFVVYRVTLP